MSTFPCLSQAIVPAIWHSRPGEEARDPNTPGLPLQHKKLAEGSAYEEVPTSVMYSENDISNSIKNGILYLEDPVNHVSTGPVGPGTVEHAERALAHKPVVFSPRSGTPTTLS